MDSRQADAYRAVLNTCNSLLHKLSKNVWSKHVPNSEDGDKQLDLHFDVQQGDSTPRRVMVCLAKQVHNCKCVAKILDRVRDAEKFVDAIEDSREKVADLEVDMSLLSSLNSHVAILTKCEAAMQRRMSLRHRVMPVTESDGINCFAICDIQCSVLGLNLSQESTLRLIDNSDPQWWTVEDSSTAAASAASAASAAAGGRLRVPPIFIGVEVGQGGEAAKIRRVKAKVTEEIKEIHCAMANQLLVTTAALQRSRSTRYLFASPQDFAAFIYRLKILEKYLRVYSSDSDDSGFGDSDFSILLETIAFLRLKVVVDKVPVDLTSPDFAEHLARLRKGLQMLQAVARSQESVQRLRQRHQRAASSCRSSRSHQLSAPHRRKSVFEFEFEFVEQTNSRSSTHRQLRPHQSVVTRQRRQVQRKFVINSVWDGAADVSLQEAIARGIVRPSSGTYIDPSGREMPIDVAMSIGRISVEATSDEKVVEDASSFGIIELEQEHRTVASVRDPATGRSLGADEAAERGLLDERRQHLLLHGRPITIEEAASRRLLAVGVTTQRKSFVVHAVVDVAAKKAVTFQEAVERQLVNVRTGAFTNSETHETLPAADAIHAGFLKAYEVDDPNSLDIDPELRITATRIHRLKNRWHAVSAFSRAGKLAHA